MIIPSVGEIGGQWQEEHERSLKCWQFLFLHLGWGYVDVHSMVNYWALHMDLYTFMCVLFHNEKDLKANNTN